MFCTDAWLPFAEENTSLIEVLSAVFQRRLTGTLLFDTTTRRLGAIVFDAGVPRKISIDDQANRLSRLLCELGWLDAYSASESYDMAVAQRVPHGQVLLELRLIDEPGLLQLLTVQLIRKLAYIADSPAETRITCYPRRDLLQDTVHAPSTWSPYAILWGLAKHQARFGRPPAHRRLPSRIEDWSTLPATTATLYGLDDQEKLLLRRLDGKVSRLAAVSAEIGLPFGVAAALIGVLDLTFPQPQPVEASQEFDPSIDLPAEREARRHEAALKYQLAKHLLHIGRIEQASQEIRRSIEQDPDNPSALALFAWIDTLLPAGNTRLDIALAALTRALDPEPMNLEIRFLRAQVLKRLDRMEEAAGEWRFIVELEPSHVDALRELRLYASRRASSRPPKRSLSGISPTGHSATTPSGLLTRLFRKSNLS